MRYGLAFLGISLACLAGSWMAWKGSGLGAVVLGYAALSLGLLAAAYAWVGPRMLLKSAAGRHSLIGWLLFGPYFLLNTAIFRLYRFMFREPAYVRVVPTLFFGRRLLAWEKTEGWASVLDLACEFPAAIPHRELPGYRSLPVLDATAPTEPELRSAVAWINEAVKSGPVYVHCALGHGRSACVVIGYLLSTQAVRTVGEGVDFLQSLRPGVRLNRPQLQLLRQFESSSEDITDLDTGPDHN